MQATAHTTLRRSIRSALFRIPGAQRVVVKMLDKAEFRGWGMECHTNTPWREGGKFSEIHKQLSRMMSSGAFRLTSTATPGLEALRWRHYIVCWTVEYATRGEGELVECGVCDGVTAFFALSASDRKAYLYDAWGPMTADHLTQSELESVGRYADLQVENTRNNLRTFSDRCVFNKGYIPEVLETARNPSRVAWMHIDLNSAGPTIAALDFFLPRMSPQGVILFDDYAHRGFDDTKHAVDAWAAGKPGRLLHMPTGQAVYFMG